MFLWRVKLLLDNDFKKSLIDIVGEGNIKYDEPMRNHTSFKVGGPADVLAVPGNACQLIEVFRLCGIKGVPVFVIGNGTNLVVRDKGIRGVVLKTANLNKFSVNGDILEAGAGTPLSEISDIALEHGLSGMEFASGIPGTLGGAVVMNAGAYGSEMRDVVMKTEYMDGSLEIKTAEGEYHRFGYRTSFIQEEGGIVLKSFLKLVKKDRSVIKAMTDELNARRKRAQPLEYPSAGSVFKRPEGYYTGKLIEECGLKGFSIGGAQISAKHCGFIVNTGGAAAKDIIDLIAYMQEAVKARFGVSLQTEIKIVGEE